MSRVLAALFRLGLCAVVGAVTAEPGDPPRTFTTAQTLETGGGKIRYRAVAGEVDVTDGGGLRPIAHNGRSRRGFCRVMPPPRCTTAGLRDGISASYSPRRGSSR